MHNLDDSQKSLLKSELDRQAGELKKLNGVVWKGVSIALIALFYWGWDTFFHGRKWDALDVFFVFIAVFLGPILWRWQEKRARLAEIRDERAIRLELKLNALLKKQDSLTR
jgi:hypothetical protein